MAGVQDFAPIHKTNTSPRESPHHDLERSCTSPLSVSHDQPSYISLSESMRQRRPLRSNTVKTYRPERKGVPWQPGGEPGIDTSAIQDGQSFRGGSLLHEECEILIVDYSQDHCAMQRLNNRTLVAFMEQPRPDWIKCRWINVNGLSWDVIKLLGNDKGLHRLAIEDMLNTKNRTKADWYSDHTYSKPFLDLVSFLGFVSISGFCVVFGFCAISGVCVISGNCFLSGVCGIFGFGANFGFCAWHLCHFWILCHPRFCCISVVDAIAEYSLVVLPLQKLIKLGSNSGYDSECWDVESAQTEEAKTSRENQAEKKSPGGRSFKSYLRKSMRWNRSQTVPLKPGGFSRDKHVLPNGFRGSHSTSTNDGLDQISLPVRTLQRYHGGPNEERIKFMEKHSALAKKNLGVGVEQVSIFLTSDSTVISFFESSAEDIETPLIPRLTIPETILRRSSDASMLVQVSHSSSDKRDMR